VTDEKNSDGTTHTVVLNGDVIERMATGSLVGKIPSVDGLKKLVLLFEETSLSWRQRHGGPNMWIVPEYTIACIIDDILWLQGHGVVVETKIKTVDDEVRHA